MKMRTATIDGLSTSTAISESPRSHRTPGRRAGRGIARSVSPPSTLLADTGVRADLLELFKCRGRILLRCEGIHRIDVVRHPALLRRGAVDQARDELILRPLVHGPLLVLA